MPNLTLEEIGKMAGVSRSTVSRVINNHPNIRAAVRENVKRIIQETGFTPNMAARSLASQRSNVIGLVIPRNVQAFFGDPYFARLTQGIAQAANQYDYTFSLFLLDSPEVEDRLIPRITRSGFIDGLVIQSTSADDKVLTRIIDSAMPYVIAGRPLEHKDVTYIDVDNVQGAKLAVEHLIKLGKKRIAMITGSQAISPGRDRQLGYQQTLSKYNMPVEQDLICNGDFTEEGGYKAARQLLAHQPDAIFIASDQMAIGALRAIRENNLRVPEDIALVGYDDLPLARVTDPQLTTVRQPVLRFGIEAVKLLLKLIEGESIAPQVNILDVELVIRDSCGGKQ